MKENGSQEKSMEEVNILMPTGKYQKAIGNKVFFKINKSTKKLR